jgi:hypothetical protein
MMRTSERRDLVSRMVSQARQLRKAAGTLTFTRSEAIGEAKGLMRAARMLKGYATMARFRDGMRRAA